METFRGQNTEVEVRSPPLVIVQFRKEDAPCRGPGVSAELARRRPEDWAALCESYPGIDVVPLFVGHDTEVLSRVVARAKRITPDYEPACFEGLFRVVLPPIGEWAQTTPDGKQGHEGLRTAIMDRLAVDYVSIETVIAPPPSSWADRNSPETLDRFHAAAPRGMSVEALWSLQGGSGEGVTVADVELGWHAGHEDFLGIDVRLLPGGRNVERWRPHGTQALSVAVARRNGKCVIGVAPLVADVVLSSEFRADSDMPITEEAIMDAIIELTGDSQGPGAILLLEVQKSVHDFVPGVEAGVLGPCEVKREIFELIRLAVASHVVVVEAAGNGGGPGLDLGNAGVLHGDSGAILVGQAMWDVDRGLVAVPSGCTGKRVDCFGLGDGIRAASTFVAKDPATGLHVFRDCDTSGFTGTSAASAMVAGLAAAVQGVVKSGDSSGTSYLSPAELRDLLRRRELGCNTPLAGDVLDVVGVMPNAQVIVEELLRRPSVIAPVDAGG
jgi:hypothetical protein